jgi:hypothetical protein
VVVSSLRLKPKPIFEAQEERKFNVMKQKELLNALFKFGDGIEV